MILKKLGRNFLPGKSNYYYLLVFRTITAYFIFWLSYFIIFRGIFLLYHYIHSSKLSAKLILGTFSHGIKMDISFSSYLTMMLLTVLSASVLLSSASTEKMIRGITIFFLALISIISVADLELYNEWGFRLDATPLIYLNTPREMVASVSSSPYLLLIMGMIATCFAGLWVYSRYVHPQFSRILPLRPLHSLILVLWAGAMIIPIRGGLQLAPMNQSSAFFSNNDFANQAAINVTWNFFWSFSKQLYSRNNPYQFMPEVEAEKLVKEFYPGDSDKAIQLLKNPRPNVIIILWESFTSRVVPELGGIYHGVVPEFESNIKDGILFNNFYANGNRSDKGIVALLSGYPPQPKTSIVKIPRKSSNLTVITRSLRDSGYYTGYFHGGELEFANIKSYLLGAGFSSIVGKDAFDKNQMNSKWGAHDHIVLERALQDISEQPTPFFNVIFTLSSHEPFEIPEPPKFPGGDLESLYKSSLHYTDQAIGTFLEKAKTEPWYENTLIIIMADHGHRLLEDGPRYNKSRFHVPMLWLGGALTERDTVISVTCSQTDVARTLLNQLEIDASQFKWSRDLLSPNTKPGAYYVYSEGISFVNGADQLVYDVPSNELLTRTGAISDEEVKRSKAQLQLTYQDYLDK